LFTRAFVLVPELDPVHHQGDPLGPVRVGALGEEGVVAADGQAPEPRDNPGRRPDAIDGTLFPQE